MRSGLTAIGAFCGVVLLTGCAGDPVGWQRATPDSPTADHSAGQETAVTCPWIEEDMPMETTSNPAGDPDRFATESIAMPDERFWPLISGIPTDPSPEDFDRISSELAGCGDEAIRGFEARLTLALYDLDGPENLAWFRDHDPMKLGFVSDDTFLYARCATVLAGLEVWQRAVQEKTLEWADDTLNETGTSELLLSVASNAAAARGETDEDFVDLTSGIRLSYESASNLARWSAT